MCKVLGLLLTIVGGFLLFEGFERKDGSAAKTDLATAAGWMNSLETSPHASRQLIFLVSGGLLIVAGVTLGTRCRPDT